ncbi:MAG TPA: Ohr family peroxiredoxin [Rhizomicrobium sp.]
MSEKILFTGKTHNVGGHNGSAKSSDDFLDLSLAQPHPAAEQLFGAAWSACFMGAIELAATQKKIALPSAPSIDAEIKLLLGEDGFFLRAHLNVSVPGLERDVAQALVDAAHQICPYSKATRGNIEVSVTLA